jgi:prepilin peptidase CpaA
MDIFLTSLLTSAIGISVVEDIRRQKIPNWVTYPCIALAIGYHTLSNGLNGLLFSLGGLALGFGFFIIPYLLGGMGAGDTKLMAAAGAILGPKGICLASFIAIFAGGIYAIILLAIYPSYARAMLGRLWITIKALILTARLVIAPPNKNEKQPILLFAIPIAVGTMSYLIMLNTGYDLFTEYFGIKLDIFSI